MAETVLPLVEDVRLWGRTHMERLTAQPDATRSGAQPAPAADSVESGGY